MARVRLDVMLDEPGRTYAPGEKVAGRVVVVADEDCTCKALTVRAGWRTAGEANAVDESGSPLHLADGEWKSGHRSAHPFSIQVPAGPPTAHLRHFSIHWSIRAEAGLSFAFDARGEAPIEVSTVPATGGSLVTKEDGGCVEGGCLLLSLAILAGGGIPILVSNRFPGVGYAIAAGVGGILALIMIPFAIAYRRIGKVEIEAGPSPLGRDEEIAVRATVTPRKNLGLRRVRAELTCVEKAEKGSGKSKKTLTMQHAKVAHTLEGPVDLVAGRTAVYAGMVPIPPNNPPTLVAGNHKVEWKVRVFVENPVLPDPSWELELDVR
jgi:hypothetical protein